MLAHRKLNYHGSNSGGGFASLVKLGAGSKKV